MVITSVSDLNFAVEDLPALPLPGNVLMTTPDYYRVEYVINPHMEGQVGTVNVSEANRQWRILLNAYENLGFQPAKMLGVENLPDMVFCANQSLPYYKPDGKRGVVLSRMYAPQRRPEVEYFARFFQERGLETTRLPSDPEMFFEGMGDAIWHPGRYLLWGGYGFRTSPRAYTFLSRELDVQVLALQLEHPHFYHLDTCFCLLDSNHVLIFPGAFRPEGLDLIHRIFTDVLEAPEEDARVRFACNAHCPDGRHVLIHRGSERTNQLLTDAGFLPVEVDTSEFFKSGGSVFCMKLMFW